MEPLSATELAQMQATADDSMMDTCLIAESDLDGSAVDWEGADPGDHGYDFSGASEVACGLNMPKAAESDGGAQVSIAEGELRLPLDTAITPTSRVRVTERHGVTLSPVEDYAVLGEAHRGPANLLVAVKRIIGTSNE